MNKINTIFFFPFYVKNSNQFPQSHKQFYAKLATVICVLFGVHVTKFVIIVRADTIVTHKNNSDVVILQNNSHFVFFIS